MIGPFSNILKRSPSHRRRRGIRFGVTYVLILGLVSVTMALSYAMMRSTVTGTLIQDNVKRNDEARLAAHAGMNIALRTMAMSTWAGVGTSLSGSLGNGQTYAVTYTTGDPSLDLSDPSIYLNNPTLLTQLLNRVTVLSTGTATTTGSTLSATYNVQTVVELVRRQLADTPTGWTTAQNYTVYQQNSANSQLNVDFPAQITGPTRVGATANLCPTYPSDPTQRTRYLTDLSNNWNSALGHNARPFTNNVDIDYNANNATFRTLLGSMGLGTNNLASTPTATWAAPNAITTYQLYAGGPIYNAYQIPSSNLTGIQNSTTPTLQPTLTNPLGIYHRAGALTLGNDVWVQGTIVLSGGTSSNLILNGSRIKLMPASNVGGLTATNPGTTETIVQLPVADVAGSFQVLSPTTATVSGQIVAASQFRVYAGNRSTIDFVLNGRVLAKDFIIDPRSDWIQTATAWNNAYSYYTTHSSSWDFPTVVFLYNTSLWPDTWASSSRPGQILINPPASSTTQFVYARKDATNTIYVANASDIVTTGETPALRWKVIDWSEGF